MKKYLVVLLLITSSFCANPALADILAIIINAKGLPYELNPSNYDNNPSNYDNSSSNYDNSDSNYDNSGSNYDNSPSNYDNGINGKRRIITEDNKFLGYYVFSSGGVLNFYSSTGIRVAYTPRGGRTKSVFSNNAWCGTMGQRSGSVVLGITLSCYAQFILDRE
ncbi:hypothetical protein NKJ48_14245 [Mesorhizobium sp. M0114]|uniref:hypothetical protein n=1 Tax=unclassified Mesorhizobium TaxID=325217 RepID=UPI003339C18B